MLTVESQGYKKEKSYVTAQGTVCNSIASKNT